MPTAPSREWILWLLTEIFVEVEREKDAFSWFCGFCCTIKLQSPVYQSVFQVYLNLVRVLLQLLVFIIIVPVSPLELFFTTLR